MDKQLNRLDEKLIAAFKKFHGRAPTIGEFKGWRHTLEGRAAVDRIVDAEWKAVGRRNPNQRPSGWPRTTWHGRKIK